MPATVNETVLDLERQRDEAIRTRNLAQAASTRDLEARRKAEQLAAVPVLPDVAELRQWLAAAERERRMWRWFWASLILNGAALAAGLALELRRVWF